MGILGVDPKSINFDDVIFCEDDPKTIIHVRRMAWHNRLNNAFNRYKQSI